jgi:hypothetical protein
VFAASAPDVRLVMAGGRVIVRDGEHVTIGDVGDALRRASWPLAAPRSAPEARTTRVIPALGIEVTTDEIEVPTGDVDVPTDDGDIPTDDGDIPTDDGDVPADDGDVPTDDGDIPTVCVATGDVQATAERPEDPTGDTEARTDGTEAKTGDIKITTGEIDPGTDGVTRTVMP